MELTLNEYLHFLNKNRFDSRNARNDLKVINKVLEIIGESNIKHFYPMNVFNEESNQEFYFFTEEKIIICKYIENNNYNLKVINRSNILNISFEESLNDSENCKLIINLKEGIVVTFESVKDSNCDWAEKYKKKIKELFKELI